MTSLIDVGKLSQPLTKMVEVVAAGIGEVYAPFGTVRRAKAEGKALVIKATAEENALAARAKTRIQWVEEVRQENIEAIVSIAAGELPEEASEDPVDADWTRQFFNAAQDVSDHDMRNLWGRILAGEVTKPGSFSKRTVEFLRTLDKIEAQNFTKFCGYLFDTNPWLTVLEVGATVEVMRKHLGTTDWLNHFVSIGLVSADRKLINASVFTGKRIKYFGQEYVFDGPEPPKNKHGIGALELHGTMQDLTQIGQQLALIAEPSPIPDFVNTINQKMQEQISVSLVPV